MPRAAFRISPRDRVGVWLLRPGEVQIGDQAASRRVRRQLGHGSDRIWQARRLGSGSGNQGHPAGSRVVRGDETASRDVARHDINKPAVAVVATSQHFEQRPVIDTLTNALAEQPHQWLGGPHHRLDSLGAIRGGRVTVQVAQVLGTPPRIPLLRAVTGSSGWANQRNTTPRARSETAGNRTWVASIRCSSVSLGVFAQRLGRRGARQPLPQQRSDNPGSARHPLLGQEDPEYRRLELRRGVETATP